MTTFPSKETSAGDGRSKRIAIAVLIALAIGVAVSAYAATGSESPADVVGGDFPAFYGAGRIAADGDWEHLYDIDRQREAQSDLLGSSGEGGVWPFVYPPQVALAFAPLSHIPYVWAYLIHTFVMAAALWASIILAAPMAQWLRGREVVAFASAMVFWPMFRAVTGGSITPLILLLIVASWRLVHDDHELQAGFVLSLLLVKPQLGLPLMGLFLVARYGRAVAGMVIGASLFYVSGALLLDWRWVLDWVETASNFGTIDAEVNGHSAISLVGFTENLGGGGFSVPVAIAWFGVIAIVFGLMWLWWKVGARHLDILLAVSMPLILLIPPHVMSHDGALVVLTVAVAMSTWAVHSWKPWVTLVWILGATQLFIKQLGFSPGFFMLLVLVGWASEPLRTRDRWLSPGTPEEITSG